MSDKAVNGVSKSAITLEIWIQESQREFFHKVYVQKLITARIEIVYHLHIVTCMWEIAFISKLSVYNWKFNNFSFRLVTIDERHKWCNFFYGKILALTGIDERSLRITIHIHKFMTNSAPVGIKHTLCSSCNLMFFFHRLQTWLNIFDMENKQKKKKIIRHFQCVPKSIQIWWPEIFS